MLMNISIDFIIFISFFFFFFQAEDGIRDKLVIGVQTCALPICSACRRPIRPAPIRPIFNEGPCKGHLLSMCLQSDGSQVGPVTLGTRLRTTHAGKDILFYDNPSPVATHAQPLSNCSERNSA